MISMPLTSFLLNHYRAASSLLPGRNLRRTTGLNTRMRSLGTFLNSCSRMVGARNDSCEPSHGLGSTKRFQRGRRPIGSAIQFRFIPTAGVCSRSPKVIHGKRRLRVMSCPRVKSFTSSAMVKICHSRKDIDV